jgi:hypothetical protein
MAKGTRRVGDCAAVKMKREYIGQRNTDELKLLTASIDRCSRNLSNTLYCEVQGLLSTRFHHKIL